jgi:hypothetical protein
MNALATPDTKHACLWPTPEQFLVLTAALGDGDRALSAFESWRSGLDDTLRFDREVFRLLPLLYDNLNRLGCTDPLMARLKGVYRMSWVKSHKLFNEMRPVVHELVDAGFDVRLLKGVPLGVRYYGNPALRPVSDIDVSVSTREAAKASTLLTRMGWLPDREPTADLFRFLHAIEFSRPNVGVVDLHWRSLCEFVDGSAEEEFRCHTEPFAFLERQVRISDPTRMLLHTIIHGVRQNPEPPVRWIADAMKILGSSGSEIKWQALVEFAQRWRLCHRLGLGLNYLSRHFDAAIPTSVLKEVAKRRATVVERVEAKTIMRTTIMRPLGEYVRFAEAKNLVSVPADFANFLRHRWRLRRRREIIGYAYRGARKHLFRHLS